MNYKHPTLQPFILLIALMLMLIACTLVEEQNEVAPAETSLYAAETVFKNGAIYTVNPNQPWVDAVAVKDGVIVAARTEAEAFAAVGGGATVIDLEGKMMLPGFQDVHLHVIEAGMNENLCFFDPEMTANQYLNELVHCAGATTSATPTWAVQNWVL